MNKLPAHLRDVLLANFDGQLRLCADLPITQRREILQAVSRALSGTPAKERKRDIGRLLSKAEVAERFGRTRRTIENWSKRGILTPVRLPGHSRCVGFREGDVSALLNAEQPDTASSYGGVLND